MYGPASTGSDANTAETARPPSANTAAAHTTATGTGTGVKTPAEILGPVQLHPQRLTPLTSGLLEPAQTRHRLRALGPADSHFCR